MDKVEQIKQKILENVKKYYNIKFNQKKEFVPGTSKINYAGRVFNDDELVNLIDSSLEFWLTEGRYTQKFQDQLAEFVGKDYCLLTTSGSSANLLAISALTSQKLNKSRRLLPGDEVITVAAAFPTTVFPIIQNNANPVFIDIELKTYNADTTKLDNALTEKTKAVFLAHTLGNPFDIERIVEFCEDNNLWLIEDNCDGLGSKYKNKYTGSFGDISTYSFYPAHHITMGEGGGVITDNKQLYRILRSLREWGRDCWCPPGHDNTCGKRFKWQLGTLPFGYDHKYTYSEFGYNLKITDMQAAIGVAQLKKLPEFIKARRINHKKLYMGLENLKDRIILPKPQDESTPSWFGFLITFKDGEKYNRTKIMRTLEDNKIQTRLLFAGNIVRQPVFNEMRQKNSGFRIIGNLKNTDKVMNDSFWIGVYPGMTDEKINYMIKEIRNLIV